jgi:hypothetical protein
LLLYRLADRLVAQPGDARGTDSPTVRFQAGHIPSCYMMCERPWVLPTADACRWLLLLLSPLLSGAGRKRRFVPVV